MKKGFEKELLLFEKEHDWNRARLFLEQVWKDDPSNPEKWCMLEFECWLIMADWEIYNGGDLIYSDFQNTLYTCVQYALSHFYEENDVLWLLGFTVSLFPFLFYIYRPNENQDYQYLAWERFGKELQRHVYECEPNYRPFNFEIAAGSCMERYFKELLKK